MGRTGNKASQESPGHRAWRSLINVQARVLARIERDLADAGQIPLAWYDVLLPLSRADNHRLRLHDLAGRAVLSRSGLTRLVDRLASEGLLKRERCAEDRRGFHAVLTARGQQAVRAAWPIYRQGIEQYFAKHMTAAQLKSLSQALSAVPEK